MSAARKYDVVVFGATGFTGQLITAYLSEKAAKGAEKFTWAIAGRSKEKLSTLAKSVKGPEPTQLIGDSSDAAALDAICKDATVVIACAGPFSLYGMSVVEACVRNNTNYIDITGEFPFVRKVIERFHKEAEEKKIFLVSQSGFDSVPSDAGNYLVHEQAKKSGATVTSVEGYFHPFGKGKGASRGTIDSTVNILKTIEKKDLNPFCLNPPGTAKGVKAPLKKGLWYNATLKSWTSPFLMAGTNEKIVRRTNGLLGNSSSYCEGMYSGSGGFIGSMMTTVFFYAVVVFLSVPPLRKILLKYAPAAGEGPNEEARKGGVKADFVGKTEDGKTIVSTMYSKDLTGYPLTAVFASEMALTIAHDIQRDGKPTPLGAVGGALTPMSTGGQLLLTRLNRNGVQFSVKDQ